VSIENWSLYFLYLSRITAYIKVPIIPAIKEKAPNKLASSSSYPNY